MPGTNLTREEASERASVVSTHHYDVALDLTGGPDVLRVPAILLGVLGLSCLRAAHWVRKTRTLTEVGLDLHVPEPDDHHDRPRRNPG